MKGFGTRRTILIVDDDPAITESLAIIFEKHGYEVRAALSAEEAIEIIAQWEPDLAILDVMLPCMNGIEFGCVLKENYPAAQIVLLSGHPESAQLLESARTRGHNFAILAKPMNPGYILDIVAGLLPGVIGEA